MGACILNQIILKVKKPANPILHSPEIFLPRWPSSPRSPDWSVALPWPYQHCGTEQEQMCFTWAGPKGQGKPQSRTASCQWLPAWCRVELTLLWMGTKREEQPKFLFKVHFFSYSTPLHNLWAKFPLSQSCFPMTSKKFNKTSSDSYNVKIKNVSFDNIWQKRKPWIFYKKNSTLLLKYWEISQNGISSLLNP